MEFTTENDYEDGQWGDDGEFYARGSKRRQTFQTKVGTARASSVTHAPVSPPQQTHNRGLPPPLPLCHARTRRFMASLPATARTRTTARRTDATASSANRDTPSRSRLPRARRRRTPAPRRRSPTRKPPRAKPSAAAARRTRSSHGSFAVRAVRNASSPTRQHHGAQAPRRGGVGSDLVARGPARTQRLVSSRSPWEREPRRPTGCSPMAPWTRELCARSRSGR